MKNTIRTIAALLSILICLRIQAQKKELSGYYISLAGDSVKGSFPNSRKWVHNPKSIPFTKDTGEKLLLTPENCRALLVPKEEIYVSYKGERMTNPTDENSALQHLVGATSTKESITAFLKKIGKAKDISFYLYKDAKRVNLYYRVGDEIIELMHKAYYEKGAVHEDPAYKDQLFTLFGGDEKLLRQIADMSYSEESLRGLLYKLNPREEKEAVKKRDSIKGVVLAAGVGSNSLQVSGDKSLAPTAMKYERSITPVIKFGYISPVGNAVGKYFLFPQLTLYAYNNKGAVVDRGLNTSRQYKASAVIAASLNFGMTLISRGRTKLFLAPGIGLTTFMGNKMIEHKQVSNAPETFVQRTIKGQDFTYGLNLQAGMTVKNKGLLWIGYSAPTLVTDQIYYSAKHSSIQVGVGIKL